MGFNPRRDARFQRTPAMAADKAAVLKSNGASEARVEPDAADGDPIWAALRREAEDAMTAEPALTGFIFATVTNHASLEETICHRISQRLGHADVDAVLIMQTFRNVLDEKPELGAGLPRRSRGRLRPRSRLHPISRAAALLQGLPRPRHLPLLPRALAQGST